MSADSIVLADREAKILEVNEATLKMYGTDDQGDLIGKSTFDLIAPEDREKTVAGMGEVLEKGYIKSREYHIITKDCSTIPVEMSVALIKDAEGKPIGFVGISRDPGPADPTSSQRGRYLCGAQGSSALAGPVGA